MQVAPYYNKPTQEGLFQHFRAIARETKLPIVLYSIPGRCGVEIGVETVKRLAADCKNIVGIKEAGGSCDRVSQLRAALGPKFTILSGDDSLTLPFMAVGAQGVISVASNVIPREVSQMVSAFARGDARKAAQLHEKFYPLFKDLFIETNPVPVKAALAMMGIDRRRIPPAARENERHEPGEAQNGAEGVWVAEMNSFNAKTLRSKSAKFLSHGCLSLRLCVFAPLR